MTASKIKELIFDKFVYKATILLLGIWVITLLNEETTLLESAEKPLKNTTIGLPENSDENSEDSENIEQQQKIRKFRKFRKSYSRSCHWLRF